MKHERRKALIARAIGGEVLWNPEKDNISNVFNWYSYNKDRDDSTKYIVDYFKATHPEIAPPSILKYLEDNRLPLTTGWLCRQVLVGVPKFSKKVDKYFSEQIKKIKKGAKVSKPVPEKVSYKPDIQERIEQQVRGYLGTIEGEIDLFLEKKFKSTFSLSNYLSSNQVKPLQAKKIMVALEETLSELKETQKGKDKDLVEGYDFLSRLQLKKFVEFISRLVEEASAWVNTAKEIGKTVRKPRKRKEKSPALLVAKLKYLREDDGKTLKSVDPESIIGAMQLWVFNTKYRMLGVYYCGNPHGFTVKGTTIQNFDEKSSVSKKLRRPEKVIPELLEAGKVALRKIMGNVVAKEKKLTGRINGDTILLRVLK